MKPRNPVRCLSVFFLLVSLPFLAFGQGGVEQKSTAKVTALLDLSAHYGDYGKEAKGGMELALAEVDNLTVEFLDCQSKNELALDFLNRLSSDTSIVISFTSWVSNAVAPVAVSKNLLQIVIASAVSKYETSSSSVRFTVDVKKEVDFLVAHLQRYDRIAIIHTDNEYGTGWKNSLQSKLGAKVIGVESYNNQTTDYAIALSNLNKLAPSALILISFGEAAEIIRQAKKAGVGAQLIGTRPIFTKELLQEPLANGLVFSYPDLDYQHPFFTRFLENFGNLPSAFGAEAYDSIMALSAALKEKGNHPDALALWFQNRTWQGAVGKIVFNACGQADYAFTLKQVKEGKAATYTP